MLDVNRTASLAEARYGTEAAMAYLTGIQALVRLPLDQRRLDIRAGLDTAGFISGYRGSPLGGFDRELWRQSADLAAHRVVFQPGVNEDLAATAVWGSQQVGLFPGARHDGVFGMWYGKAPGLDRSCDAVRHANAAGTNPLGGVLLVVGDDHGCKSSTLPSASEFALRDLGVPVFAPADVQDVLDFGLAGWAMSRYAGCWTGLVAVTDVMDSALTVGVELGRHRFVCPPHDERPHLRLADSPMEQEARMATKLRLASEFASANPIDRVVTDPRKPRLVVVTAGKTYADVREAMDKLDMGSQEAIEGAGVRLVKLGLTWPLDPERVAQFCRGARRVLVVEEKRPFVEDQLKAILFGRPIEILGKNASPGRSGTVPSGLLPTTGELDVPTIAAALVTVLERVADTGYLGEVATAAGALPGDAQPAKEARKPLYCAGCPHSVSTRVPQGSRAAAGIGCHYMVQWMDRNTATVTHMGAEGVNWIGQAPFTDEDHIFANLGDGTYFHSGILAIRAAVAAGVNITYKVLFNDAVAMTGGQLVDGSLSVADIVAQVRAEGVSAVRVVSDDPRRHRGAAFRVAPRKHLDTVQRQLRATAGCSVLIYDQTCAAELRRRRKRGTAVDPDVRAVINDAVCEGCGDCSAQSNCVAVEPLETEFGVKRTINQTACNKDLSCLDGFCPAFVTLSGAKRKAGVAIEHAATTTLPAPAVGCRAANVLIAGVGGTGIVTTSQILSTAVHLDGGFVSALDMTGLAQKGGAVLGHVRISPAGSGHPPTRIPAASVDILIGADAVTAASRDVLGLTSPHRTTVILNTHLAPTAAFVLRQGQDDSFGKLHERLRQRSKRLASVDANATTKAMFGSTDYANIFLMGYAFQAAAIPVSLEALERAITLNGVAVANNLAAFHQGRRAAHDARLWSDPDAEEVEHPSAAMVLPAEAMQPRRSRSLDERIATRSAFLVSYQDQALARRYEELVSRIRAAEQRVEPDSVVLVEAVSESYFKLLAVKDEYEVARLFTERLAGSGGDFRAKLANQFEPGFKATYHFAPPLLAFAGRDANGRPKKIAVGGWITPVLRLLSKMRRLRGSVLDPFRISAERRLERQLREQFEADIDHVVESLDDANFDTAVALVRLPAGIKGFGPVKEAAARIASDRRRTYLAELHTPPAPVRVGTQGVPTPEHEAA